MTTNPVQHDCADAWLRKSEPFATPFFLFDRGKVLRNFSEFQRCFPGAAIHYAMKANSEPEILRILTTAGCGFEAASMCELKMLEEIGVVPDRIIFGSAVKAKEHIAAFVRYGVDRFAFDSLSELHKLAAAARLSCIRQSES